MKSVWIGNVVDQDGSIWKESDLMLTIRLLSDRVAIRICIGEDERIDLSPAAARSLAYRLSMVANQAATANYAGFGNPDAEVFCQFGNAYPEWEGADMDDLTPENVPYAGEGYRG
jgi:hypothetical protein